MPRTTGRYKITRAGNEEVRAFIPYPLPPTKPALEITGSLHEQNVAATLALGKLSVAAQMVPSADWFLYGFVRKEAVISSQIEGTQATLTDVLAYETTGKSDRPDDVEEICNYVKAITWARKEIGRSGGLPLSTRLLCEVHRRLMQGVRGEDKHPGEIRTSQNWIGGSRPGNAAYVPPPPEEVPDALSALDRWWHSSDSLPPIVRAGLAHAQFETIHPFLDGNGRVGRMSITLLIEHWGLLSTPLLYLSLAFKRRRDEYYRRLTAIRREGDWEGWTEFFLDSVCVAADDGALIAQRLFALLNQDRVALLKHAGTTIPTLRLFEKLPSHPMVTLPQVMKVLDTTKPTAAKAIDALQQAHVLEEITGKQRDRVYAYQRYLDLLTKETD
ncbi:MAG: Fic family protein [Planctomycetes bacterium]|nr:Fic family protein [Planctomycetota bacterium]